MGLSKGEANGNKSPRKQVNAATQKKSASHCTQNFAGNESSSNAVMSLQIDASNDSQNTSKLIPLQSNGFFEVNATNSSMITNDPSENSSANQKSRCSANTGNILCGSNKSTNKEPEICGSKDLDRVRILAAILQEEKIVCSFMQQDVAELEEMVKICTFQQLLKIRIRFAKQNVKKLRQQPPLTYFSEDTTVMNKYRKALNEFAKAAIEREICDTGRADGFKRPAKGCHPVDNVLEDEEEMEEEQLKPGKALLRVAYRLKTDVETTAPQNLKILLIQIARLESKIPCITESACRFARRWKASRNLLGSGDVLHQYFRAHAGTADSSRACMQETLSQMNPSNVSNKTNPETLWQKSCCVARSKWRVIKEAALIVKGAVQGFDREEVRPKSLQKLFGKDPVLKSMFPCGGDLRKFLNEAYEVANATEF